MPSRRTRKLNKESMALRLQSTSFSYARSPLVTCEASALTREFRTSCARVVFLEDPADRRNRVHRLDHGARRARSPYFIVRARAVPQRLWRLRLGFNATRR